MIFRNRRQFLTIDAYHHIGGTQYNKIMVRNAETTEFKHKYYDHDRFVYKSDALSFNLNGLKINSSADSHKKIVSARSASTSTYLAVATIKSKTATSNSHVSYQLARFGSYVHDTSTVNFNVDAIFSYDNQNLRTFIPRGANTDIYADEESGGGSGGGLSITQYWS